MKKLLKSIVGVTLLEIMLVLAIAAMVIMMSVRYYATATSSSQANAGYALMQAIASAADILGGPRNSYTGMTNTTITPLLPNQTTTLPWGTTATVNGGSATTYTVTVPSIPSAVCTLLDARMKTNVHWTTVTQTGTCGAAPSTISYTYSM